MFLNHREIVHNFITGKRQHSGRLRAQAGALGNRQLVELHQLSPAGPLLHPHLHSPDESGWLSVAALEVCLRDG